MFKYLSFLFLSLVSYGQITTLPPASGSGGGSATASGYSAAVTAQTTLTVTAATHGQGTSPVAGCFDNSTPAVSVSCSYTRNTSGDVVFTWAPAFTGTVNIWAGAGTSGISGGGNLTTVGAIPYVSSAGVLNQDATKLFWDSANSRLGVGTASPSHAISIVGTSPVYLQIQGSGNNSYLGMVAGVQTMQSDAAIAFRPNSTEVARFAATTGNLLIGTTTDNTTDKLQVTGSVSATGGFTGALTGNASTATALASTVASGRLWIGQGTGVPTSDSVICADTTNHRLGVGTCAPSFLFHALTSSTRYFAFNNNIATIRSDNNTFPPTLNFENQAGSGTGSLDFYTYSGQTVPTLRWQGLDETNFTGSHYFYTATGGSANQPLIERLRVGATVLVSNATLETTASSTSAPVWSMVVRNSNNGGTTGYGAGLKLKNSSESGAEANKWAGIAAIATATFSNDTAMAFYSASGTASAPTEKMRLLGNGNFLIGTTTDLGYGLHAANRGTNGNLLVFDPTATTGTTKAVVRAGAGQSGNIFEINRVDGLIAGGVYAKLLGANDVQFGLLSSGGSQGVALHGGGLQAGLSASIQFGLGTVTGVNTTTFDLSLSRASAGVLQVGDGGANANGYLTAARIGVGTASPGQAVQIVGNVQVGGSSAFNNRVDFVSDSRSISFSLRGGGAALPGMFELYDNTAAASRMAFATTGNLLIGGTTDGNYKLDVQNSGSTGTLRVYDQTATTGNTKEVIRAGAGQSTNLTEWQNNAGTVLGFVRASDGVLGSTILSTADIQTAALSNSGNSYTAGLNLKSAGGIGWSSTGNWFDTKDTGLARNAAGVLEVNNGTAGTYRDLRVRSVFITQSTPAASTDACTAGALWADATYIYACTASGTIKRATLATF